MRILAVEPGPNFSVADVHDGWVSALRYMGAKVDNINLGDRLDFYSQRLPPEEAIRLTNNSLHAVCYQHRPDVLLITSCFYLTAQTLDVIRAHGTRIVILHTESPYEDDHQLIRATRADLNLINDPTNLDKFQDIAPSFYVPHAYRPDRHRPTPATDEYRSDFAFVGTGFPSRVEFLEAVDWSGIDVALAGHWQMLNVDSPLRGFVAHEIDECIPNASTAQMYASTQVSANLYRREAQRPELSTGWSMGPREVELAAMGTFFLRDPRPEGDDVLWMLPRFTGPEDFGEQLRWYLQRPETRQDIADKARTAIADRTYENHARMLLRLLGA